MRSIRFQLPRWSPVQLIVVINLAKETDMTVSASIQAFCAELQTRIPAAVAAAVTADRIAQEPAIQKRIDDAVTAATAEAVQDDSDGAAALETALDAVAPAAPSA